jgi:N utilization substance protein A
MEREQARAIEARRHPDELSPAERMMRVRGMSEKTVEALALSGYKTPEDLARETDITKLGDSPAIGIKKARQLKSAAESYLLEEAKLRAELDAERAALGASASAPPSTEEAKAP